MGVNGTGQIYKGFTFDGIKSKDYGVYITGEGVYNAPVRDVEMITIPNRNGSFVLDHGRFENIEVTYPAGMFGATQTDFADGINALRNALASRKGYVRLEDEYNPNEYRMAVYKSGLEVSPVQYGQAGEFEIVFECKPQRFLKSGETAVSVANNGTITNPTLFESRPTLQIWGYGQANLGDESVKINSTALGEVNMYRASDVNPDLYYKFDLANTDVLNNGDTITAQFELLTLIHYNAGYTPNLVQLINNSYFEYAGGTIISGYSTAILDTTLTVTFLAGTSATKPSPYAEAEFSVRCYDGIQSYVVQPKIRLYLSYNATLKQISATPSLVWSGDQTGIKNTSREYDDIIITGDSTQSALGQPVYFDLDIGEAYKIENNQMISINNAVTMPAELPTLKPGATTVTYDNTITQFKIVPRWWIV